MDEAKKSLASREFLALSQLTPPMYQFILTNPNARFLELFTFEELKVTTVPFLQKLCEESNEVLQGFIHYRRQEIKNKVELNKTGYKKPTSNPTFDSEDFKRFQAHMAKKDDLLFQELQESDEIKEENKNEIDQLIAELMGVDPPTLLIKLEKGENMEVVKDSKEKRKPNEITQSGEEEMPRLEELENSINTTSMLQTRTENLSSHSFQQPIPHKNKHHKIGESRNEKSSSTQIPKPSF